MSKFFTLKQWGLRNLLLPAGDALLGHPMMKRLRQLEQAQWWPREQIEGERNRLLANVVATTYAEVPFYRDLFENAGVKPADIRCPADLRKLPVVTKALLRAAYPDRCCRKVRGRTYETSTSGSTGQNFRVREDRETAGWYRASFLLALEWAGWRIGEPHAQVGMTTQRNFERRLKDALMGCYYVSGFDLSDPALDRCLGTLERKKIRHLWGYPGSLFAIARRAEQVGWNIPLKSIVTWGDQLHPHYRDLIERVFRANVSDTYGCGEGMHIAAQCGHGPHYHIHELDVIAEFLDENGHPMPEGKPGRIVLTRLHAGPMPFIRYEIGDVGVASVGRSCACGRNLKLLESIQGRTADYILTPSGNRLIVHFFTGILEHFKEIDCFQVRQEKPDELRLLILPREGFSATTESAVRQALREKGADMKIDIQLVPDIPLTPGGKRRFVIRDLNSGETVDSGRPSSSPAITPWAT